MCISPSVLFWACFFLSSTFPYQCCWPHSFIAILSQKFYSVLSQCPSLPVLLFIFFNCRNWSCTYQSHWEFGTELSNNGVRTLLRKLGNSVAFKILNDTKRHSHKLIWSWGIGRKTYTVKTRLWMGKWDKSETVMESKN